MLKPDEFAEIVESRAFRSVLIVEDEGLLSMMLEDLAREAGASEVQVCCRSREALDAARETPLDCAILDVSVTDNTSYDVADALAARNIPFFFCTGLSAADIEARHRHRPLLAKPYRDADFRAVLAQTLAG